MLSSLSERRHQHGFPGRAFLHLAVADSTVVDGAVGLAPAFGERHADHHRQAVAERAGRGLDAGIAVVGVDAEPAVRRAVVVEILRGQDAQLFEDHVLDHAAVALRHQEGVGRLRRPASGRISPW